MKTAISLVLTAVLVVALSTNSSAGDKNAVVHKNSDLIGKVIKNKTGEHLGYVEDLVINVPSGRIAFAALSTKNTLGLGGKLYALPLSAFGMAPDYSHLILDVPKNEFEGIAGFDANRWPEKVTESKWAKLAKHPEGTMDKHQHLVRLTSLNGLAVRNPSNAEDLGKVQGFGVDCTHDKIGYVAMSRGGVVGIGSKYFAIPWDAMRVRSLNFRVQDHVFALNATKDQLERATGFDPNNWPNVGDPSFTKEAKKAPTN